MPALLWLALLLLALALRVLASPLRRPLAAARLVARDAADPYGAPRFAWRAAEDTTGPVYRITGKEDDTLSGAVALGARHCLPQLGRWASPDLHLLVDRPEAALETPGEANPYGYVGGNPVTFTDPTGRKGLAHGSENRPGVLDSCPCSDGPAFQDRMAAVARDRALAEYRQAQLAVMALGVLDAALTGLDWALTASPIRPPEDRTTVNYPRR